jgi:hypothetical protein
MAEEQAQARSPYPDPAEWKAQFDDAVRQWNEFLTGMMGTEAFAAANSRYMDSFLDFQRVMGQSVERYLQALNVPTRSDFTLLAERIASIEDQLDEVSRKIDLLSDQPTQPRPRGGRTTKEQ